MQTLEDFLYYEKPKKQKLIIPNIIDGTNHNTPFIPKSERKESTIFFEPLVPPKVVTGISTPDTFFCFIQALISRYPHYEYLLATRSRYFTKKLYWFKDTRKSITIIMTIDEVKDKIK